MFITPDCNQVKIYVRHREWDHKAIRSLYLHSVGLAYQTQVQQKNGCMSNLAAGFTSLDKVARFQIDTRLRKCGAEN